MQEIQGGWAGAWGGVGDGERNYTTSINLLYSLSVFQPPTHTHTHTHTPSLLIISLSPTSSHLSLFFSHLICSLSLFLHRIFLHLIPFSSSPSICYFQLHCDSFPSLFHWFAVLLPLLLYSRLDWWIQIDMSQWDFSVGQRVHVEVRMFPLRYNLLCICDGAQDYVNLFPLYFNSIDRFIDVE